MLRKTHKHQDGFTIIEIMIVLAIAGLIMLIVFLAVPALQRSARNTQRKNDVSAISAAIANYIDNNGGALPANIGGTNSPLQICGSSCATGNTETATLGYYVATDVSIGTSPPATQTDADVYLDLGYGCNANNTGVGNATPRTVAVLYAVESSTSTVSQQCTE